MEHEKYIKRCYGLAVNAGKKGYDTFGAVIVYNGKILEEAENTADRERGIFGHAEFNLVHKCANKYSDEILSGCVFYTSCAPCARCLSAIMSLGIKKVVYGVSYQKFSLLTPCGYKRVDYEKLFGEMDINIEMCGPVSEDEGMRVFEYWGGEYHPLEELIAQMEAIKKSNSD